MKTAEKTADRGRRRLGSIREIGKVLPLVFIACLLWPFGYTALVISS